jgi:hypothetical protein
MGKRSVPPPQADRIWHLLDYDPSTGIFTWKNPPGVKIKRGARAGCLEGGSRGGYRVIVIDGKHYRSSALAILYVTGRFPSVLVDHKNRNPGDDRFKNLRAADYSENAFNAAAHRDNRSGLKGVHLHKPGVYRAQITARGKRRHLGLFQTPYEAHSAYLAAAKRLHGRFFCGGDNRKAH